MKAIIVFLAFIGVGFAAPKPESVIKHKSLIDDLWDFVAILPIDEIGDIVNEHLETDGAFDAVVLYLQGDDWAALVDEVGSKPAVQDFFQYLTNAGFPVDIIIGAIHDLIQNAVPGTEPDDNGSLRPFLDHLESILPVDDLVALLNDKLQNSPDFQDLYVEISSEDARALVEEVRTIPEVQRLAQRLRDFGVKIDEALAVIYDFFGWGEPAVKKSHRSLLDDIGDFLDILPIPEILDILNEHLQTDGSVVAVVEYLQGDDWAALIAEIGSKPGVQDIIQYFDDAGVPAEVILNLINELIQNAVPGTEADENGSLRPFLDHLESILPVDDLVALLNDKLQNSPDFQDLYVKISSEATRTLVEEIRAIPEVQRLAQRLRDFGVKIDEGLAVIYDFLGWGKPKKF